MPQDTTLPIVAVGGSQLGEFRLVALVGTEGNMRRVIFIKGGEREFYIPRDYTERLIPAPCVLAPMRIAPVGTQTPLPGVAVPSQLGEENKFKISKGSYTTAMNAFPDTDSESDDSKSDSSSSVELISRTEAKRPAPAAPAPSKLPRDERSPEQISIDQASSSIRAIHNCVYVTKLIADGADGECDVRGAEYRINLFEQKISTLSTKQKASIRFMNESQINEIILALQGDRQNLFLRAATVFSKLGGPTTMMTALFQLATTKNTDDRVVNSLKKCLICEAGG
eukprot:TRINITY_DN21858_c0_g1_i1.p1 TRINITY_DN21858_c0_g1~~TRINITY_DN21858_c0_g1_i1.p1  ORF type:complete len:282 (+),score=44.38 TRINITY_DN21858_c0_g1_i1:66-911(+)